MYLTTWWHKASSFHFCGAENSVSYPGNFDIGILGADSGLVIYYYSLTVGFVICLSLFISSKGANCGMFFRERGGFL